MEIEQNRARAFKFDDPEQAYKNARRRITNNALRRKQKSLDLAGFGLTQLPPEIGQLSELRQLHLAGNRLGSLPPEIGKLSQLEVLTLTNNEIKTLPIELWDLTSLRNIDLESNQLAEIPDQIGRLYNLQILDLSENKLSVIPGGVGGLAKLRHLNLAGNQLLELRPEIGQLKSLKDLVLDSNALSALPKEIGQLTNLESLSVTDNQLRSLPDTIGEMSSLDSLYIEGNKLEQLPKTISNLKHLSLLDLDDNALTALPTEIGDLTSLESLYVSNNRVGVIPAEIGKLQRLRFLHVGGNEITTIPKEIEHLVNLRRLSFERNKIETIPAQIGGLGSLNALLLSENRLENIPPEIGQLNRLAHLALENNKLTALPKELGQLRSLERTASDRNRFPRSPKVGLIVTNNPLPDPYPVLLAFGQPLATFNILAWLRGELDPSSLSLAAPTPQREGTDVAPPPQPSLELGPSFQLVGGRLDLVAASEPTSNYDLEVQEILQKRLLQQTQLLQRENIKVGNQHPLLVRTIEEYERIASDPLDELNVVDLWAVGNSLMAQALSFEKQDSKLTITEPLEPAHLALLTDVSRLHGGFILGFPKGIALTDRADAARIAPEVSDLIGKPTSRVLGALSRQRKLASERVRSLAEVLDTALITTGWQTARVGYSSYVTVRNFLIEMGKTLVLANEKASSPAGGALVAAALAASGMTPETLVLMIDFFKTNVGDILSFVAPFPELRSWIGWIIDHFDGELSGKDTKRQERQAN